MVSKNNGILSFNAAAKISVRPRKNTAEGGCGGNSAVFLPKIEAKPAALLVQSRTQQKSFLFLLEEKIRRAHIRKSEENFFAGWRVPASGGGLASLVWFRSGISDKMSSSQTVKTHHVGNCKFERFASRSLSALSADSAANWYSIFGVKTNSRFRILGEENFLIQYR